MSSQVEICNLALIEFGDITITVITDNTSKEARACNALWNSTRDYLLKKYPWNFAMRRKDLGAYLPEAPASEYAYQYALPTEPYCLRVWELYGSDANWIVEGRNLLTNDESANIRYIAQITDISTYSPEYVQCFAKLMASKLAPKLAGDIGKKMKPELLKEFNWLVLEAYRLNAIEGKPRLLKDEQPVDTGNYTWQTEGR